jgi:TonB family protein
MRSPCIEISLAMQKDCSHLSHVRALFLCAALLPFAGWAAETPRGELISAKLAEASKAAKDLERARSRASPESAQLGTDERGRTLKQDLQTYVLTDDARTRIEGLRREIPALLKAGDEDGASRAVVALHGVLNTQIELFNSIVAYWRAPGTTVVPTPKAEAHRTEWEQVLRGIGIDPPERAQQRTLQERRKAEIAAGDFVSAMQKTEPELAIVRHQVQYAISTELRAALSSGTFKPALEAQVMPACVPASESSGDNMPRVWRNLPNANDYMPASYPGGEIRVAVAVLVDAEGCARRIAVVLSSGLEDTDRAAVNLARDARYLPAGKDAQRMEGLIVYNVVFSR